MTRAVDVPSVVVRADHVPGQPQGRWTYDAYAALPDDGMRYEIIDGVLYMAAAPNTAHQTAAGRFTYYLLTHVEFAGVGRVFAAPFDVELARSVVVSRTSWSCSTVTCRSSRRSASSACPIW